MSSSQHCSGVAQPYRLIQAAVDGDLVLCTSPALLTELRDVLARGHPGARLQQQNSSVAEAVTLYGALTVKVSPTETPPRVVPGDADDDHVIAAAIAAEAQFVVSGDRHLLALSSYQDIRIIAPAEAARLSVASKS
jgi:putative PIN family toxin of toxin-antitoxin system